MKKTHITPLDGAQMYWINSGEEQICQYALSLFSFVSAYGKLCFLWKKN